MATSLVGDSTILELTLLYKDDFENSLLIMFVDQGVKENRYLLKSTTKQIKNGEQISIGTDFDYTDELFRHTLPVFDSIPSFLIRFPEKTVEIKNVSVLWMSPSQKIVAVQRYSNLNTKEGWKLIDIPEKQLNNGLWALIYINGSDEVCILEYLILNEFENIPEDNVELKKTEFDAIKSIIGQKSKDTKSWIESTFEFQDFCEVGSTCEKSNLTGVHHSTRVEESPTVLAKTEANLEWCDPLGALIGENKIDLQSPPLDWSSLERKFANLTVGGHHKPQGTA